MTTLNEFSVNGKNNHKNPVILLTNILLTSGSSVTLLEEAKPMIY